MRCLLIALLLLPCICFAQLSDEAWDDIQRDMRRNYDRAEQEIQQKRQESALFRFVKTRGHKPPQLPGNDREGQDEAAHD